MPKNEDTVLDEFDHESFYRQIIEQEFEEEEVKKVFERDSKVIFEKISE